MSRGAIMEEIARTSKNPQGYADSALRYRKMAGLLHAPSAAKPVADLASGGCGERGDFPSYVVRIDDVFFCRAMVKELVGLERVF